MIKLNFEQRQQAEALVQKGVASDEGAFQIVALRDFVQYVRDFYQQNFSVMPVAFQTVDNEAEAILEDTAP